MKKLFTIAFVAVLALFCAACGGSGAPAGGSEAAAPALETKVAASGGMIFTATGEVSDTAEGEVTVKEGESLVIAGSLEAGEVEIAAGDDFTDYLYPGDGVGQSDIEPGTYKIVAKTKDTTGTFYVTSFPSDTLNFEDSESSELVAQVAEHIGE